LIPLNRRYDSCPPNLDIIRSTPRTSVRSGHREALRQLRLGIAGAQARELARWAGEPKLEFDLVDFTSSEAVRSLTELVRALVHQISDQRLLISPVAVCELEEVISVQLLFAGPAPVQRSTPSQTIGDIIRTRLTVAVGNAEIEKALAT
jgi:hypothetical protein